MTIAAVNGVQLYYESTGAGFPLVFLHESCGNYKSWDAQVRFFSRYYRVITYNARGYPPSDVPSSLSEYSQALVAEDLHQLLLSLGISLAYVAGLSMGGGTALRFAIDHPDMVRALVLASTGAGAVNREQLLGVVGRLARELEGGQFGPEAEAFMRSPTRTRLPRKNPKAWDEVWDEFTGFSTLGLSLTFQGVVTRRKPVDELTHELSRLTIPTLIVAGDEDSACLEPSLLMRRYLPNSGLCIFPRSGHLLSAEEPDRFNQSLFAFLLDVEKGQW